jgi:hypothetical protein
MVLPVLVCADEVHMVLQLSYQLCLCFALHSLYTVVQVCRRRVPMMVHKSGGTEWPIQLFDNGLAAAAAAGAAGAAGMTVGQLTAAAPSLSQKAPLRSATHAW